MRRSTEGRPGAGEPRLPVRDPRTPRGGRETTATIIYALILGPVLFIVGVTGFIRDPTLFFGGALGEPLRSVLAVGYAQDLLRIVAGLAGVSACLSLRTDLYCRTLGIIFAAFGALGVVLEISTLFGLPSANLTASIVYLALGVLALLCSFTSPPTARDAGSGPGSIGTSPRLSSLQHPETPPK